MNCPECKRDIRESWNFCPECGAVLYGRKHEVPFPDVVIMCYGHTTSLVIGGYHIYGINGIKFSHNPDENDGLPRLEVDMDIIKDLIGKAPRVSKFWREELKKAVLMEQDRHSC